MSQKGLAPIIIVILIVAAIGGYLVYSGKINIPQKQTEISNVDETANWKIYTNDKHRFVIKHPNEIRIIPIKSDYAVNFELWGSTQKENTEFDDGVSLTFRSDSLAGKTLKEFVDMKAGLGEIIIPVSPVTLAGLEGYTYRERTLGEHTYIYLSPKSGTYFEIVNSTNDPTSKGFQKIVEQMLSTLNFTN